jgi:hypothetical protein
MEAIATFQEFMSWTKSVTYLLTICSLIGIAWFWSFLTEKDGN